jgi:methyl-accepting chemotaxis protein
MTSTSVTVDSKTRPRKPIFISLRWKLLVGFTLLFSIVFALAFYWFYTFATTQALNRIQADLLDTLNGASKSIDAETLVSLAADPGVPNASGEAWLAVANAEEDETTDAAQLREFAAQSFGEKTVIGFSDDPRYQKLMNELQVIHDIEPRAWPYIFIKAEGEQRLTYIADAWARYDPSKAAPFMFTRSSKRSYNGLNKLTQRLDDNNNFTPYTDDFGNWISAYQPILDANGNSVGAVGVDFEADYVYEVQGAIRDRVFTAFVVTYVGLFILVFWVSRTLTRPISNLTVAAARIGEGDYTQDLTEVKPGGRISDEIGTLADVFMIMTGKVYQREQTLRKQVEALKIEIDDSKRKAQVSEIADTDFFRELQKKAREMRSRTDDEGDSKKSPG